MKRTILAAFLCLLLTFTLNAQLSGTYNVPGTYTSIAAAINDLNSLGVSSSVTIEVTSGYTETAPSGGYTLNAISGASSLNQIFFRKTGALANPLITAASGGSGTPGSAVQDGVWRFVGTDYVTIDGIDIIDPNNSNPATMEFGYGFFKASATDGCQNNTIKNCVITLNRINNASGTAPATDGSRGIDVVNALTGSHTSAVSVSSSAGAHSNNKFYTNTIQNCNIGIALIGFAASSPFSLADTGNDVGGNSSATGNTIVNYGGGGSNPAAAVRTLAQYDLNVSFNNINNNTGAGVTHTAVLRGIFVNTATSANVGVSSNTVSLISGGTTQLLAGIDNASGSTAAGNAINLNNNIITNCSYTSATTAVFNAILNSGTAATVNINNNAVSSVTIGGTGTAVLIETGSPSNASASSNTISSIVRTGASGSFRLIKTTSPAACTFSNNLIDGVSWTNLSSTGSVDCIYGLSSSVDVTISGNIIRNISIPLTGTANGIREFGTSGVKTIQNNQVYSFSTTAGGAGGATFNGIFCSTGSISISNNTVFSLDNTGGTGGVVNGIQISGGSQNNVFKNRIYNLSSSSTGAVVNGINLTGGTTNNVSNNLVGALSASASVGANAIVGFNITSGNTAYVYYNSIYLNAASAGSLFGTSALYVTTATNLDLRNNIFVNLSTPSGTAISAAYRRSSTTLSSYSLTSNNNLFYASTPSASTAIFYDGTTVYQTLAAFKALVANRDANSVTENPAFVSTSGANANFLNINTGVPTQIESGGIPLASITDDHVGTIRNLSTPDIGAWEGNFMGLDMNAPALVASGFGSPACNTGSRTFTVSLSDFTGVATGSLAPRVYYKVNAGAYTSVQGVLSSGTVFNGVWSFSLTFSAAVQDVISYYLVAQDASGSPNLMAQPSAGFAGSDVNTVSTAPTTPFTYTVTGTLNGVYTVGSGGNFATLTDAAAAYNLNCLTGPVTFSLTDATYSTAETFPIVFLNNADASSTNSLLIRPAAGLAVSISGTNTSAAAAIKCLNARFITFDGINSGGSSLTINNPNTGTSANIWLASSGPGNQGIAIRRLNINGGNTTSGSYGIIAGNDAATPSTTGGADNDYVVIEENTIQRAYYGIYANGTSSVNAGGLDVWQISNNIIGPASSGTNNIGAAGIYMQNAAYIQISANLIRNVNTSASSNIGGIYLAANVMTLVVSQNTINAVTSSASSSGINSINGLYFGNSIMFATVTFNTISGIYNTNSSGYGARGIIVNTGNTLGNITVNNNMISDIVSYSDASAIYWPIGISVDGSANNVNIDFNSVNLFGSQTGRSAATGAAALYQNATGGNIRIRNNILANSYDNTTSSTDISYALYSAASATNISAMNYNNYYVGGNASSLILAYQGAAQNSIPAIQAAFGGNANSLSLTPVFVSNTDLHMQLISANAALDNMGGPLAGITTDIDGQSRSATTPDIGADEYLVPVCTIASGGVVSPSSISGCDGATISLSSTGYNTGINSVYQWQVSTTSGSSYTNVAGVNATTPSFTTSPLVPGTYYYILTASCTSASLTASSNEVTVTINAIPTATASASPSVLCSGQSFSLIGSSDIGSTFMWTGPGGFTSGQLNPGMGSVAYTATGNYTFMAAANGCTSVPSSVFVTINATPSAVTVTPSSASICAGSSETVVASGGLIPAVFNFTPQVNQNTSTTYPAPYSVYYGGQKMQFLVLASELTAAGMSAGPLYSLQFPVISKNANWGNSLTSNQNFQVSIGTTTLSAVGSQFQTGLTVVSPVTNFTPVVGYNNIHTFSNPFNWDGTSNLIIETVFSNNMSGASADAVIQYNSPTNFQSTMVYRADNQSFATIAAANGTNTATNLKRPDFKLNGTGIGNFTWTPATGLNVSSGASVTASPLVNTVYTVTSLNGACTSENTVSINVTPLPTLSLVSTPTAICVGESATVTVSGASSYTWDTGAQTSSIVVSPSLNTAYTASNITAPCAVVATSINVVVNPLPVLSAMASASAVCVGDSVNLAVSGANTYSWSTGTIGSTVNVAPAQNTTYTVTGIDAQGCVSSETLAIVSNALPVLSITPPSATVCSGSPVSFTASGASSYSWDTGAITSTLQVSPAVNTSYTVTGTDGLGCSSTETLTIFTNTLPVVVIAQSAASVCPSAPVSFTASGATSYVWNTQTPGPVLTSSPAVATSYTVTGTSGDGCVSETSATVGVYPLPVIGIQPASNVTVCLNSETTFIASGGSSYLWSDGSTTASLVTTATGNTVHTVTATSSVGCSSSETVAISTKSLPLISVTPSSATICANESVVFNASGASTFTWAPANESGNTFSTIPTGNTTYTVKGTDVNDCENTVTVEVVVETCTGLNSNDLSSMVQLYPNPSSGFISAKLELEGQKEIIVTSSTGAEVARYSTESRYYQFDLSSHAKGIYFVRLNAGTSTASFRIILY